MTHRTFTARLSLILVGAILAIAAIGATSASAHHLTPATAKPCMEDDPCWNWVTMGNHKRGVVTLWGNPMVVGACKFQRLMRAGRIAYTVKVGGKTYKTLDRLKGDRLALTGDCD